jgi:hypothetical protein
MEQGSAFGTPYCRRRIPYTRSYTNGRGVLDQGATLRIVGNGEYGEASMVFVGVIPMFTIPSVVAVLYKYRYSLIDRPRWNMCNLRYHSIQFSPARTDNAKSSDRRDHNDAEQKVCISDHLASGIKTIRTCCDPFLFLYRQISPFRRRIYIQIRTNTYYSPCSHTIHLDWQHIYPIISPMHLGLSCEWPSEPCGLLARSHLTSHRVTVGLCSERT